MSLASISRFERFFDRLVVPFLVVFGLVAVASLAAIAI